MTFCVKYLSLICIIIFTSKAFAANETYGTLAVVKGDVQVESAKNKSIQKAKMGTKVFPGDTVVTKKDSRAKLVMVDKNIINISPDSRFALEKYEYNPEQNKKGALINVIYGKIRTTVIQKYDADKNKFQVKTKSSVAGVRGTDFMVSYNQGTNISKVVTFEGKVEVGQGFDASGRIQNPVSVTPGKFTVVAANAAPTAPAAVPPAELNSMKEQSVAEAPVGPGKDDAKEGDQREPTGEKKDEKKDEKKEGDKPGREPSGRPGPGPAMGSGSVLDEMGEDVAAPVADGVGGLQPPVDLVPRDPSSSPPGCPGGNCGMPPPMDPNLLNGTSNVLINLQPQ